MAAAAGVVALAALALLGWLIMISRQQTACLLSMHEELSRIASALGAPPRRNALPPILLKGGKS